MLVWYKAGMKHSLPGRVQGTFRKIFRKQFHCE